MSKRLTSLAIATFLFFGVFGVLLNKNTNAALDPFSDACSGSAATQNSSVCNTDGSTNPVSGNDGIISKAINIFSFLTGAASVIMIIIGAIKYITAGGESSKVTSAKSTITYALIGVVVFLMSRAILTFVINKI